MIYPELNEKLYTSEAKPTCPLKSGINSDCTPDCAWWVQGRCAVTWLAELVAREVRVI